MPMPPPPAEQFAARVFLGPTLRAQPDRRLVDLVRDGYDAAFEEIVRRYRRPLDRFAAAIVGGQLVQHLPPSAALHVAAAMVAAIASPT